MTTPTRFDILNRIDLGTTPQQAAAHWDARQEISRQAWVGQWQKRFAQAPDW